MSNVDQIIEPREKDLGDNFIVRRVLPYAKKRLIGPFIFWDHMGPVELSPEKKMVVRAHPHIGLATVTYLFSGEIMHRDSLNNEQLIVPGEVNWMTAGKGIVHSERVEIESGKQILEGIQVWVALPKDKEDVAPSFIHRKKAELPFFNVESTQLRLIVGKYNQFESPIPVYSDLFYLNGKTPKGNSYTQDLKPNHEGAIYIIKGDVEVDNKTYTRFDMISFKEGTSIEFKALTDVEFMILGGETFPEKRHIWWNFVSTDVEKIEKAKIDWKEQNFPSVVNEKEFTPLPEY